MAAKLPTHARLVNGEHEGPFPPSYYAGHEKSDYRLFPEIAHWCGAKYGYSPLVYWGSDANDEEDLGIVEFDGWVTFFKEDTHAVEFALRWHDNTKLLRELLDVGSVDASDEFNHSHFLLLSNLMVRSFFSLNMATVGKYVTIFCDDWRVSFFHDTVKVGGCIHSLRDFFKKASGQNENRNR